MEKCHVIRAQYGAIGDELQGRMPLAYAHIVQVLLDVVLWMYPFMALSTGMAWYISILGTGLLTMFYQGLFDLAKQFLDPYDNENYGKGDDPLVIDTLIAETNAGSVRWMNSFQQQPWNRQSLNDGELYDSLLPLRGYSVEDLAEREAQEEKERLEWEAVKEEKKRREEEKDRRRAEELLQRHVETMGTGTEAAPPSIVAERRDNGTVALSPEGEDLMVSAVDGEMDGDRTLMEVSGGEVVATSSLLPSSIGLGETEESSEESFPSGADGVNATDTGERKNKVLTLADGTLVTSEDITSDDSLTINITESNTTTSLEVAAELEGTPPPLLDEANEVPWVQLGNTPIFEESIAEMEAYKEMSSPTPEESPPVPLYDTKNYISTADSKLEDNLKDEDLDDEDIFEPMTIEWFDEVGPDGQEYRLSQMLADEDWPDDEEDETDLGISDFLSAGGPLSPNVNDPKNKTMTYDEFTQKASEMIEQAENELAETKEILSVSPGSHAGLDVNINRDSSLSPAASLPTRRNKAMEEPPMDTSYDQTQLDGISQLWGAAPDVLEQNANEEDGISEDYLINEGKDFRGVYSLWGEGAESEMASADDEEGPPSSTSIEGFSQLWNEDLAPFEPGKLDGDFRTSSVDPLLNINDLKAFAGVEWWDEVSDDGSFKSLSQMLADEEYEETMEEEAETPMTFEQFAEETEKLIEQAEDEREETEAIMNAPPFANFLEGDEEDLDASSAVEKSVVASDKFKEMIMSLSEGEDEDLEEEEETISDEEIGVLEMDGFSEDEEGSGLIVDTHDDDREVENDSFPQSTFESEKKAEVSGDSD